MLCGKMIRSVLSKLFAGTEKVDDFEGVLVSIYILWKTSPVLVVNAMACTWRVKMKWVYAPQQYSQVGESDISAQPKP